MASVRPRTSINWDFFEKLDGEMAQCRICLKEYSHKSLSNLKKHLDKKHPTAVYDGYEGVDIESLDQMDALEDTKPVRALSDVSVEKLASSDDDGDRQDGKREEDSNVELASAGRRTSEIWHHFRRIDYAIAECKVCHRRLSYATNTSNLRKHLARKHGSLRTDSRDYIPPTSPLTEVFLKGAPSPKTKRRPRRASSAWREQYSTDSDDTPKKLKRRKQRSDAHEPPDDEIDHFGRYVTALLKKLPRPLSNKMQVDIVTLIMNTQMQHEQTACETSAVGTSGDAPAIDGTNTSHST